MNFAIYNGKGYDFIYDVDDEEWENVVDAWICEHTLLIKTKE